MNTERIKEKKMTDLRTAAQQALEALEECLYATTDKSEFLAFEAITALRAALAESEPKTAWAHLPNAAHIDRILAHLKAHPDKWTAAAWGAAWGAAWDAISALIAWDYAGELLSLPPEQVKARADEGNHAAVLIYPAMLAMREDK